MRQAFVQSLLEIAAQDGRLLVLTGDLGFMVFEPFADRFPARFINAGVAEQNMVGVATGLAEAGYIPFVYSIAPFASLRPLEFIRNGPILHNLPVRIVGVGTGFDYGHAGFTHHAIEDIGVLRTQRGLSIVVPADAEQTRSAILATWNTPGPVYYSLGKAGRGPIPGLSGRFALGRAEIVRVGSGEVVILAMGSVAHEAVAAAEALGRIDCTVVVLASVAPPPSDDIARILSKAQIAVTVETHVAVGGIGSLVSEIVASRALRCRVVSCAVREGWDGRSGSTEWYLARHGLDRQSVVRRIEAEYR
jgi:transketolase